MQDYFEGNKAETQAECLIENKVSPSYFKRIHVCCYETRDKVNLIIEEFHSFNDIPLLRRELISRKCLSRKDDGSEYWKTNK